MILFPLLLALNASAATYDPSADRAALRQAATGCHAAIVDATGLPLEPEKVPSIVKGLDEGLRLGRAAADTAGGLDAAARTRAKDMKAATDSLDRRLKESSAPVAAERRRIDAGIAGLKEFKTKIEKLPDEDQKKFAPRVAKADASLKSAAEALGPAEAAVLVMGQRVLEMKAALRQGGKALEEVSSASTGTVLAAGELADPVAELKRRLSDVGKPPVETSRARVQEVIEPARGASLRLFQAADRACNRADDFRRASSAHADASEAFEKSLSSANPAPAKPFLEEADKMLTLIRELLEKKP